ncbi:MAG TPA: trehalose-phosphatase, partial [Longimicrobiales bacterium]|nr:trehalose-phosphatase [Longimicrobiales bacterium]
MYLGVMAAPPHALAEWPHLATKLAGLSPAVFLDYDGTLAPIAERPELARVSADMRATVEALAERWPTAVISGRKREDVAAMLGVENVTYAGSHGFDVAGPHEHLRLTVEPTARPELAAAMAELKERLGDIPGILIEDKRLSVAVHYRQVPAERVPEVAAAVKQMTVKYNRLTKKTGKKLYELRPAVAWDKGRVIHWLLGALELDRPDVRPIYIGDDETDEDGFRALANRGITIVVCEQPRETSA